MSKIKKGNKVYILLKQIVAFTVAYVSNLEKLVLNILLWTSFIAVVC